MSKVFFVKTNVKKNELKSSVMVKKLLFFMCLMFGVSILAQEKTITGKVVDESDMPIPGVSVFVKGTSKGVVTDFDGNYTLSKVQVPAQVVYSFVGFQTQTRDITSELDGNEVKINIVMKEQLQQLSDVVVVGFGKQKKENLTGAVATVDAKNLENRPVSNAVQALQGAVAGMNFSVNNGGGELNNALSFNIRGSGTIGNTSASPLVLIDGMEGDITSLNPQDIESISVLKDAASSSIYGSRAAFGVILIKTKSGRKGKVQVSYTQNLRFSTPLLQPKMLDSERFAYYWNDSAENGGVEKPFTEEILQKIIAYKKGELPANDVSTWDSEKGEWKNYYRSWANVNWFKQLYRENVPSQEHTLSVRGGTEDLNFYLSANYLDQEGLLRYNTDRFTKGGVLSNINAKINNYARIGYKMQFTRTDYDRPFWQTFLFYHNIARRWPTLPVYDPNGHYFKGNEIAHLEGGNERKKSDLWTQQFSLVLTPLKNWTINAELNYKTRSTSTHSFAKPIFSYDDKGNPLPLSYGGLGLTKPGQTFVKDYGYRNTYLNPNVYTDYIFTLKENHNFKVMSGFQVEVFEYTDFSARREDMYTPTVLEINATYGENDDVTGQRQKWATAGVFGRLNYDYKSKYLFELNSRYDGTSRYLADKRWNLFTSFSLGWNVTKEDFWEKLGDFAQKITTLKPRFSYGELGNQNTKSWYPFYQTMPVEANTGDWLINNKRTNKASAPDLVSELLTWERISTVNYGVDLSMFDNRLSFVFDYFVRKTKGMVGPAPTLPATLGARPPQFNNTDMESKGFELEASWTDQLKSGLGYSVKLSLTDNYQVVTSYPNETGNINEWYSGKRFGDIWGFTTIGIAKSKAEMDAHLAKANQDMIGSKWDMGDIMYADINGDGKISKGGQTLKDHGDLTIIGNSTPRYNFGLNLGVNYKGWDASIFLQGTLKRDILVGGVYFEGANGGMWQNAGFEEHLDYFRPEGTSSPFGANTDSYFPRPIQNGGGKNFMPQTRWLQNGAYIRLKSLQIGYTIPSNITEKVGISKFRIYFAGENLWTYTKMIKIFDPESFGGQWGDGKLYPLSTVLSTGVNINF